MPDAPKRSLDVVVEYIQNEMFMHPDTLVRCMSMLNRMLSFDGSLRFVLVYHGAVDMPTLRAASDAMAGGDLMLFKSSEPVKPSVSVLESLMVGGLDRCSSDFVLSVPFWWIPVRGIDVSAPFDRMSSDPDTAAIMFAGGKHVFPRNVRELTYFSRDAGGYDAVCSNHYSCKHLFDAYAPQLVRRSEFSSGGRMSPRPSGDIFATESEKMICNLSYYGQKKNVVLHVKRDDVRFVDALGMHDRYWPAQAVSLIPAESNGGRTFRVIVPYYNVSRYIDECLASIACQTIADRVFVSICDDASSDDEHAALMRAVESCGMPPGHVTVKRLAKNSGPGTARNEAMSEFLDCDYTLFLDPDDKFVDERCVEDIDKGISENGEPDVLCYTFRTGAKGGIKDENPKVMPDSPDTILPTRSDISVCPWVKCVRTSKVPAMPEGRIWAEDVVWTFRLAGCVDTVASIRRPIVWYRLNSQTSLLHSGLRDNVTKYSKLARGYFRLLSDVMSGRVRKEYLEDVCNHAVRDMAWWEARLTD